MSSESETSVGGGQQSGVSPFLWGCLCAVAFVCCEVGARLDDWFFDQIPIFSNTSYDSLFTVDQQGLRHGVPGARWKKVTINNLGFRGPDLSQTRAPGCGRWIFLGASETFGEPSIANGEYPSKVRNLITRESCIEVLNSAFPGIPPQQLESYFASELKQLQPTVVFIYPSTHFYLADAPAQSSARNKSEPAAPAQSSFSIGNLLTESRFFERLKDTAEVPAFIQRWRVQGWIDAQLLDKPADWQFKSPPAERLDALAVDITNLIHAIEASGARPVILTHAVRVTDPPRPEDHDDLFAMRVYVPRATERVLADFEYAAADRLRRVAQAEGVAMIDIARALSGRRELFIDLVHFAPAGHEKVAQAIVDYTRQQAIR